MTLSDEDLFSGEQMSMDHLKNLMAELNMPKKAEETNRDIDVEMLEQEFHDFFNQKNKK